MRFSYPRFTWETVELRVKCPDFGVELYGFLCEIYWLHGLYTGLYGFQCEIYWLQDLLVTLATFYNLLKSQLIHL